MTVTQPNPQPNATIPPDGIVVGVDRSEHSHAAVRWAATRAAATGCPLTLLTVSLADDDLREADRQLLLTLDDDQQFLRSLTQKVRHDHPGLEVEWRVDVGAAVPRILEDGAESRLIALGRRGLGTFARLLLGSTSVAVAGRATAPVAVVPDDWDGAEHARGSVVVGVDAEDVDEQSLRYAFAEAQRLEVDLVAVHGPGISSTLVWDPAVYAEVHDQLLSEARERLEAALVTFRAAFPDVTVRTEVQLSHAGDLILQEEPRAQLVVLGRKREGHFGFAFGSITRGVLHYATVPVVVVPPSLSS